MLKQIKALSLLLTFAFLLLLLELVALAQYESLPVGAVWTYSRTTKTATETIEDTVNKEVVCAGISGCRAGRFIQFSSQNAGEEEMMGISLDVDGNRLTKFGKSGLLFHLDSPILFPRQLKVGDSLKQETYAKAEMEVSCGESQGVFNGIAEITHSAQVIAEETITVPAGTFVCFKTEEHLKIQFLSTSLEGIPKGKMKRLPKPDGILKVDTTSWLSDKMGEVKIVKKQMEFDGTTSEQTLTLTKRAYNSKKRPDLSKQNMM
jgi:hypothetical protein